MSQTLSFIPPKKIKRIKYMLTINLLYMSVLIHVLSAIAWLGSLVALDFILIPSFISSSDVEWLISSNRKYALIARITSLLILITGICQTFHLGYLDITKLFQTSYGNLILLKVILFFIFAGLAVKAAHDIDNSDPNISKENLQLVLVKERKLLYIDLLIGLIIIIIDIALVYNVGFTI